MIQNFYILHSNNNLFKLLFELISFYILCVLDLENCWISKGLVRKACKEENGGSCGSSTIEQFSSIERSSFNRASTFVFSLFWILDYVLERTGG